MRIWHEQLIPKLCQKHLCAMWRESLGAYKIITENKKGYRNHPAVKEFYYAPLSLWMRLKAVRDEMENRMYKPKLLPPCPYDVDIDDVREWQTLEEQISHLKSKGCKCQV